MMGELWHFTCDHGHKGLGQQGLTRPNWQPLLGVALTWFSDTTAPGRDGLGLTSESGLIHCDRMAYRYRVTDSSAHLKIHRWLGSIQQANTDPHIQATLHLFSKPIHWWISLTPVLVTLEVSDV